MYVPHERRALILRLLEQRGYLRSAQLARELGVTDETIRTDLIALHEQRLLRRVHGGARFIPPGGGAEDNTRLDCQLIRSLLPHLQKGMVVYLDPGSYANTLLGSMSELPCTLLTPSPSLVMQLAAPAIPHRAIIPGGELDKTSRLISSSDAASFFRRHRPQLALLFPHALPEPGRIAYRREAQAAWAAAAGAAAERTIITAPAHAFYSSAEHSAPCSAHLIITEDNLPPGYDTQPVELIPYLSAADIHPQGDDFPASRL